MEPGVWTGILSHVQMTFFEMWDRTIDGKRTVEGQGLGFSTVIFHPDPSRNTEF